MNAITIVLLITLAVASAQCPGACGRQQPAAPKPAAACPSASSGTCPSAATSGCGNAAVETDHCHWLEVDGVVPGSIAEQAGIQPGDMLHSYGGRTVGCLNDLGAAREAATGEVVDVVFRRGGQELTARVARGQPLGVYLHEWLNDLVPDADAKLVRNVPSLSWSTGRTSSFMAALEAALYPLGDRAGYTYLSGVSGAAFRTHFFTDWCPSSPDPRCGYRTDLAAFASRGVTARDLPLATDGKNRPQLLKAIRASIDSGVPVLAWGIGAGDAALEHAVITGYQKQGEELLVRSYGDRRKGYDLASNFPRQVTIIRRGTVPDEIASCRKGFAIVAENLSTERYGQYYSGLAAFDRWLELLKADSFAGMDSAAFARVVRANYWLLVRLVSDRRTGLDYLGALTDFWLPRHAQTYSALAQLYAEEVDILGPLVSALPEPGAATRPEHWSADQKSRQITALERARELEAKALPLWQQLAAAE